jgi:hypothetical protein
MRSFNYPTVFVFHNQDVFHKAADAIAGLTVTNGPVSSDPSYRHSVADGRRVPFLAVIHPYNTVVKA